MPLKQLAQPYTYTSEPLAYMSKPESTMYNHENISNIINNAMHAYRIILLSFCF
jgi:hypothetical protein